MKILRTLMCGAFMLVATGLFAQVQINKPIQLTGGAGERTITNLEIPVNGTDAVNKDYVDAAVAAAGGSDPTMVSDESGSVTFGDAVRYCRNLSESGHSDWYLPTYEQLIKVISTGGASVPNESSTEYIWVLNGSTGSGTQWAMIRLSDGYISSNAGNNLRKVRCVR